MRKLTIAVLIVFLRFGACAAPAAEDFNKGTNAAPVRTPVGAQAHDRRLNDVEAAERMRAQCIEGRRFISGRVLQVSREGVVVDSGYSSLMNPPFNKSWVVPGTVSVERDPHAVEERKPDSLCVGLVMLSNTPKRPAVKAYDYVVMHGYPAGEYTYKPVPGVEKRIRRFSASLERAVELDLKRSESSSGRATHEPDR